MVIHFTFQSSDGYNCEHYYLYVTYFPFFCNAVVSYVFAFFCFWNYSELECSLHLTGVEREGEKFEGVYAYMNILSAHEYLGLLCLKMFYKYYITSP